MINVILDKTKEKFWEKVIKGAVENAVKAAASTIAVEISKITINETYTRLKGKDDSESKKEEKEETADKKD